MEMKIMLLSLVIAVILTIRKAAVKVIDDTENPKEKISSDEFLKRFHEKGGRNVRQNGSLQKGD